MSHTVSVAIISHNYGRFLREAIDSVLAQTLLPVELVIVDDASTDDTAAVAAEYADIGVRYVRVDTGNIYLNRVRVAAEMRGDILLFLDADDVIPPDYLAEGVKCFRNSTVGIVYSDLLCFGAEFAYRKFPDPHAVDLSIRNACHAGSLVRRAALETSGAMEATPTRNTHADWYMWRRIVQAGWSIDKNHAAYHYRKHGQSMQQTAAGVTYADLIVAEDEPLTLWLPLSGRNELWPRMAEWLDHQHWPTERVQLVLCDTSQDWQFGETVKQWAAACQWRDVRYFRLNVGRRGLADEDRHSVAVQNAVRPAVATIYRTMAQQVSTAFVTVIEDDIRPPDNALELLWAGMDEHVASVSGAYRSRFHGNYVAHNIAGQPISTAPGGITQVGFNGFGCVLLRTRALRDLGIQHATPTRDYDRNFYAALTAGNFIARVNWNCECQHIEAGRTFGTDANHLAAEGRT